MRNMVEGPLMLLRERKVSKNRAARGPSTAFGGPPPLQMQGRI